MSYERDPCYAQVGYPYPVQQLMREVPYQYGDMEKAGNQDGSRAGHWPGLCALSQWQFCDRAKVKSRSHR